MQVAFFLPACRLFSRIVRQGSAAVHNKNKSAEPPGDPLIERRGQPRSQGTSSDWETIVLKRIERHVEAVSAGISEPSATTDQPGWEDAALLALRRRIRDLKTD